MCGCNGIAPATCASILNMRFYHHCSRALVTIDLTAAVLEEAADFDADLIIAYHPPIFSGIKRLTAAPLVQRAAAAGWALCLQLVAL